MTLSLPARTLPLAATARWLALLFFALLAFLPAQATLPVTDRDEARFVQSSRQMVDTGDYIDIRFQDEPRYKKPVGIYWLQSAAVLAFGGGSDAPLWVYRLPSLAGAVLSVLLVALVGTPLFGRQAALLGAAVFAAGLVIGGEARIAKTDAALLATILIAQAALARLYLRQAAGRGLAFAFWLAVAGGALIKGPIGPMVPALTILALIALDRRADWLRPLWSPWPILLAVALVVPWFAAITLRSDGAFWSGSIGADLLPKIASGQEGKGAPPGSYLALMWLTFWPATPLLLLALPAIWRSRQRAATRFCLAWAIPVWLVHEAVPTKLIHYTLPAYPALALLAVAHLSEGLATAGRLLRGLAALAILPGFVLGIWVARHAIAQEAWPAATWALIGLGAALLATGFALHSASRGSPWTLSAQAAVAGAVLHAALISAAARLPDLWPTDQAMAVARQIATDQGCDRPQVTGWGYAEPSLVWSAGTDTALHPATAPAAEVVRPAACQVVIHARDAATTPLPLIRGCSVARTVSGFALGAGRRVTLDVLDCRGGT